MDRRDPETIGNVCWPHIDPDRRDDATASTGIDRPPLRLIQGFIGGLWRVWEER